MPNFANAPGEMFYHFVKKNQTVDDLIRELYQQPNPLAIDHFKVINSHLKDNRVKVGQMVVVTPPNSQQCSRWEAELAEVARKVDATLAKLSEEEARIMAENYQLLSNATQWGSAGVGATMIYFNRHVRNIEGILKQVNDLYVKTYKTTGGLNNPQFFQKRKALFSRLNTTLSSLVGESRLGFSFDQGQVKKGLGLSSKSALHQWKQQPYAVNDVPGFSNNFAKVARLSKNLRIGGYAAIGLDVGHSAVKIHEACTVGEGKECARTSFGEGGRLSGSIVGGAGGGALASYVACNVVFGIQTVGTSLLWCGIVAGASGGFLGGKYVGMIGRELGNVLYEKTY